MMTQNKESSVISMKSQFNIRSLRLRLGWSQAEMARRLSLNPVDIASIEKGSFALTPSLRGELEIILRQADESCEEQKKSALSDCDKD
jgi:ribosome-binding protein aMBF1 (putative translation factor)